jgi:hypothetical protein
MGQWVRIRDVARGAIVLGVCALARSAAAEVQSPTLALTWRAPDPSCPDEVHVDAEVARLLGGTYAPADAHVTARAVVERSGQGIWRVDLETERSPDTGGGVARGHRVIDAPSCAEVADAAALILAMLINPARVQSTSAAPAAVPAAAPASARNSGAPPEEPANEAPASGAIDLGSSPWRWALLGAAIGDLGTVPGPSAGAEIAAGGSSDWRVAAEASAFYEPPQTFRSVAAKAGAGGRFSVWGLAVRAGFPVGGRPVSFVPYAGGEYARIAAHGVGIADAGSGSAARWSVLAGGYVVWWIAAHVGARAQIEAVIPLQRPEFFIEGLGTVYREPGVAGRALVGIELSP